MVSITHTTALVVAFANLLAGAWAALRWLPRINAATTDPAA